MNQLSTRSWLSAGHFTHRGLIAVLIVCCLLPFARTFSQGRLKTPSVNASVLAAQDVRWLEPGKPIERELAGGQIHAYRITLNGDQYLQLVVDQRGIDVAVALVSPDGATLADVDSPNGTQGPETISLVTRLEGNYQLEVRSLEKTAATGRYEVLINELRPATAQDRSWLLAEKLFAEGEHLHGQKTAAARRQAIEKYQEAIPLWQAAGDLQREARTRTNIGVAYDNLSEPQQALDHYNQALPLWQTAGDRQGESSTLNNLGVVYNSLGEKQKALDCYHQALPLLRAVGAQRQEAITLSGLGRIYHSLGEINKALDYFDQSLQIRRAVDDLNGQAQTLSGIGAIYRDLGENSKAIELISQSLPLYRSVQDFRGEAATLANLGTLSFALDNPQQALGYFEQALNLSQTLGDRSGEGRALAFMGRAYKQLGKRQQALDYFSQSLELSRAVQNRAGEAQTLGNLGEIYAESGEREKAFEYFGQALRIHQALKDRRNEANTLAHLARAERQRNNLNEAETLMKTALAIFETLRATVPSQELRAAYFASVQANYQFHADLLMQFHRLHPTEGFAARALQTSERARARSLLELLTEARADIRQGIDPALLARERLLQQRVNGKAEYQLLLLRGRPAQKQADAVKKELDGLISELQQIETQIRQSSPRYATLKYPAPISLSEVQQLLDADTLLLEYALGEERSYLWAVTPDSVSGFELPGRAKLEAAARRVYELLAVNPRPASKANAAARYTEAVAALSRLLLAPISEQLGKKRLLIVADGALQYLPFAALPEPESGEAVSRENPHSALRTPHSFSPLIANHEIVSLPSVSTLAALRRELAGRTAAPKLVAVLADPVFEPDDVRFGKRAGKAAAPKPRVRRSGEEAAVFRSAAEVGIIDAQQRFQRLAFSRREADAIFALAPPQTGFKAVDFAANRAAAISPGLAQYRIVHFATHGLLNSLHPSLSGVVLSLVDEQGRPQDGFLRLHDIYNLKLNADLVVLSACQTALGKEVRGEGLIGLTRGFMYAGAPRVMASLWKVDDRATAELMKQFYRRLLGEGMRPAAALRAAQLDMQRQPRWAAPRYWAGFVLQGEWK